MKVICDNCQTKYNAPDDKVRGRTLKIKCKKCSHLIVVSGIEDAADNSASYAAAYQERSLEMSASVTEVWHLVVNDQQIGPLSTDDVSLRLQRGEVSVDTFAWREGFANWSPLSTIPEFAAFAPPVSEPEVESTSLYNMNAEAPAVESFAAPSEAAVSSPKLSLSKSPAVASAPVVASFASAPVVADPFVSAPAAADSFASAPAAADPFVSVPAAADPFASAPAAADPFASAPVPAPAASPFGQAPSSNAMTAARADSSVLFSLTNLQALAVGTKDSKGSPKAPPSATGNTEGSGLIDIRSMSSALQFSKEKEKKSAVPASEEIVFGGTAPSVVGFSGNSADAFATAAVSGVMLPRENKSKTTMLFAIMGGIAAVVLLTLGVLFFAGVFDKSPAAAPTAMIAAAPTENGQPSVAAAPAPTGDVTTSVAATPTEVAAAVPVSKDSKTPVKSAALPTNSKTTATATPAPSKASSSDPILAALNTKPVAVTPAPEPVKPTNTGKHNDELDDILNGGKSGSGGSSGGSSGPDTLTQSQIQKVMNSGKFDSCKAVGTGKVSAKVIISSSGSVTGVSTDGTPVGSCVAGVIKRLKFPSIGAASQTFSYPVFVR